MPTTSLKLPDALKARVAAAAERSEKSPHAFMVDAIARQVEDEESEAHFVQRALDSLAEVEGGGATFAAEDVHAWLLATARGERAKSPAPSDPNAAAGTAGLIVEAVSLLARHPHIGRGLKGGLRELVISRGGSGSLALYRVDLLRERGLVLAIRHQRERGFVG